MDKLLAYLAATGAFANSAASAFDALAANAPAEAQGPLKAVAAEARAIAAAEADVAAFLTHPDANKLWEYIKHHGNLPGTPESRGER